MQPHWASQTCPVHRCATSIWRKDLNDNLACLSAGLPDTAIQRSQLQLFTKHNDRQYAMCAKASAACNDEKTYAAYKQYSCFVAAKLVSGSICTKNQTTGPCQVAPVARSPRRLVMPNLPPCFVFPRLPDPDLHKPSCQQYTGLVLTVAVARERRTL